MKTMRILVPLFLLLLALPGCGRKGPLMAPDLHRFPAVADLSARQQGNGTLVSWSSPYGPGAGVTSFRVFRRDVLPPGQDCDECTDSYRLVRTVDLELPVGVQRDAGRFLFSDTEVQPGMTYQYRLKAFLADGSEAATSNNARVALVTLPHAPRVGVETTPVSAILSWEPVPAAAEGADVRYRVYRRQGDEPYGLTPITEKPLVKTRYEDFPPQRGATWHYVVRGLVTVNGVPAETAASEEITVTLPPDER